MSILLEPVLLLPILEFPIPSNNPYFLLNPVSLVIPGIVTGWNNYKLPADSGNPKELIVHLGDVQKAGVPPGVHPGLRNIRDEKTSTCSSGDLEIKTDKFLLFVKQRDKVFFVYFLSFGVLCFFHRTND